MEQGAVKGPVTLSAWGVAVKAAAPIPWTGRPGEAPWWGASARATRTQVRVALMAKRLASPSSAVACLSDRADPGDRVGRRGVSLVFGLRPDAVGTDPGELHPESVSQEGEDRPDGGDVRSHDL